MMMMMISFFLFHYNEAVREIKKKRARFGGMTRMLMSHRTAKTREIFIPQRNFRSLTKPIAAKTPATDDQTNKPKTFIIHVSKTEERYNSMTN
jgi:hypothetical protein